MLTESFFGFVGTRVERSREGSKLSAMIHMYEMREFVTDHIVDHPDRELDQLSIESYMLFGRTRASFGRLRSDKDFFV